MKLQFKSFATGFWNGLAAPAILFSTYLGPVKREVKIDRLYNPAPNAKKALRKDVSSISRDFYSVVRKHEQK